MHNDLFYIVFNGIRDRELGLYVMHRPSIPCPEKNIEEKQILGRDGSITIDYGTYKNIEITVEYNFLNKIDYINKSRIIKKWINNIRDNKLKFSDSLDYFYKVKYCKLDVIERVTKKVGKFSLKFVCDPYTYLDMLDPIQILNNITLYNEYDICKPIYFLSGEGLIKLIVNGKEVTINLGQNCIIDTERRVCYRRDGTLINTSIKGEYEDLFLKEHENTINYKGNITKLEMIPNYRFI